MLVNIVSIIIKPECRDAFEAVTLHNHENTRREPGNIRFDVLRCSDETEPNKYILYEVFADADAVSHHKTTAHYKRWAEEAAAYTAAPREKSGYLPLAFD